MSNVILQQSKPKCIVVDADKNTLHLIRSAARNWYEILETSDAQQALQLLAAHPDIAVFIANHGNSRFDGIGLLERVRNDYPDVRRVVMTSYLDLSRIIHGLHSGIIQKMVQMPISIPELQNAIIPFEAHGASAAAPGHGASAGKTSLLA